MDFKSLLSNKWFLGAALLVGVYALYVRSRQPAGDTATSASNAALAANQGGIGAIVSQLQTNQGNLASLLSGSADTIAQSVSGQSLAFQSAFNKLTDAQAGGFGALLNRLTGISKQAEQIGNEGAANTQTIIDRLTGISKQAEQIGNEGAANTSTLAGLLRSLSQQFSQLGDEQAQSRYWLLGQTITNTCQERGDSNLLCSYGLSAAGIPNAQRYAFIQESAQCISPDKTGSDVHCLGTLVEKYRFRQGG